METTHENAAWGGGNDSLKSQCTDNYSIYSEDTRETMDVEGQIATGEILVTRITSHNPTRLTKRFELDQEGQLVKHLGGQLVSGTAEQINISDLNDLSMKLASLASAQAMTYGIAADHPSAPVVTDAAHQEGDGCITRTRRYFGYRRAPGIMMLDHDAKSAEYEPKELIAALRSVAPSLANVSLLWRASASSGIVTTADGQELNGLCGQRLYLLVSDAALIPEAGQALVNLCWAKGLGRIDVGAAGQALERTLFDATVWQPERLDLAAGPALGSGLGRQVPEPFVDGDSAARFDLRLLIAEADQGVISKATAARKQAREAKTEALACARQTWLDEQAPKLAEKRQITVEVARDTLERAAARYRLDMDFVLSAHGGADVTVRELLENRERWHGQRFADPLEPEYRDDDRIAWANLRSGGQLSITIQKLPGINIEFFPVERATQRV